MANITNFAIINFLEKYCEKVKKDESDSHVELMMDDHFCVEYKGHKYYVPETNSLFDKSDEEVQEHLFDIFSLMCNNLYRMYVKVIY